MTRPEIEWERSFAFTGRYFGYPGGQRGEPATWQLQKMDPRVEKRPRRWRLLHVPTMGVTYFPSMAMAKAYADDIQFLHEAEEAP